MEPDSRKVKLLCSFDGAIHGRPADGALRYVGGINHLLSLRRSSSFSDLSDKISSLFPPPFAVKYQLPGEDLDALVSISTPEDLENMMEEFDRIDVISSDGSARIRIFVFSPADLGRDLVVDTGPEGYVDAINGRRGALACSSFEDLSRFGVLGLSGESSQTRVSSGIGDRGVRLFNPHVNALNLMVESPKTDQDQKCTSQDSPSEANSNGNAVGNIDSIDGDIAIVGSSYQDSIESWRTGHQGVQFLNPNANAVVVHPVYSPGGNLNQSQKNEKYFPIGSPKINHEEIPDQRTDHKCTDQEENPLWEANKMKQMQDSLRILNQGVLFNNPNVNAVNVQGVVLSIPVENRKINQEEIPQGTDLKHTTQDENILSEGNTMKQTLDSLRICHQGMNPLREVNEIVIPTKIDHPGVQVLNPNGNPVGVHQGVQLLSPNINAVNVCPVYMAGDNLDQIEGNVESFPLKNLCGGNSKTSQEEFPQRTDQICTAPEGNLLLEANETLIHPKIDHPGAQVPNQNGNFGFCPVYGRNLPTGSTAVNLNPKQGKVEPCFEENVYTISNQNYFYTNNGNVSHHHHHHHHQPLNQVPPLQPLYITPLPLSYVPPLRPGPHRMLRLDNCHMCQRELLHSHSDMLANEQCNGNVPGSTTISDAARTLASHNSEDPMRLQAVHRVMTASEPSIENYPYENQKAVCQSPSHANVLHQPVMAGVLSDSVRLQPQQRADIGGLVDIDAEPKVEITTVSCHPAAYGVIQKPHESESPVHKKVVARGDRFRYFSPPCTMGLSRETQLTYGVSVNHEIPPKCHLEESLQQFLLTSNKQFGFHGTSVVNANFPAIDATSQVSVPEVSYDYARTINKMMDAHHVSKFESTGFYEQQKHAVAVDVSKPTAAMSRNLQVVENSHAIGSKIGGNTVFVGNAFENPVIIPEGNSVRPIFQMQPGAEDLKPEQHPPLVAGNMSVRPHVGGSAAYLGNAFTSSGILPEPNPINAIDHMLPLSLNSACFLPPAEIFHLPSLMDNHRPPFSYSQEMRVEPEVPIGCFHGMSTYSGAIDPACESKFKSNMIIKIPVEASKDEASRSCLKDVINIPGPPSGNIPAQHLNSSCHTENVEHLQGPIRSNCPHQILGSVQMVSSRPDKPSNKEFVAPLDLGSENCQLSKVLPPTANGSFDCPLNSMTNHSCLEPVHFPQGVEHNKQGSQAGADEQQMASFLQSSVPSVPAPLSLEKKESDPQSNKESGLVVGNASLQSAMTPDEKKTEDIETKQSDKMNLGSLVTDNIGHLQIIKNSDLEELQELGSGSFGTVYHGKWKGSDVAIKRISNRCFAGKPSEGERMRGDFWNEACKLADLHHPNVVAFYGVVLDGPEGSYATVTEFMANGSLRQALQRNNRSLDEQKRLLIAMDVAFGMEYLHDKNIVHFDLKSDNLLVNLKDPQRPICKVADLGLSKVKRQTLISGGVRGTLPWMAIELLNGSSCLVSEKVDVFSFGIVMWELLTGEEPYAEMHYGAIIGGIVNNTLRPPVPKFCDPDWRLLMEQCWSSDPSQRPSFTEIASRLRSMAGSPPKKDNLRH